MRIRSWTAAGILSVLAGCAASPSPEGAYQLLQLAMASCTQAHGYDPEATGELGAQALGPGERAWRLCVYSAIEAHMIPSTTIPAAYRRLIDEDRAMTDKIAAGTMTREARDKRIDALAEAIELQEKGAKARAEAQLRELRDLDDRRRRQEEIDRIHRQINAARDALRMRL